MAVTFFDPNRETDFNECFQVQVPDPSSVLA